MIQVRIDVIVHATENELLVADSLTQMLRINPQSLHTLTSEGHYHNIITTMRAHLQKEEADHTLEHILTHMPASDLCTIQNTLPDRVDGSTLYIRLDKQDMVSGRIRLNDSGTIRIRIIMPIYDGRVIDAFTNLLCLNT